VHEAVWLLQSILSKAVKAGRLAPRPQQKPLYVILNSKSRRTIKVRLLEAGILKNVCDECGISEWRGKRISIQIDHINGIPDDHRLENLRMLCPNCHSQTETFAAKNILRKKRTHLALIPDSLIG
jgi:HNH endonuclease